MKIHNNKTIINNYSGLSLAQIGNFLDCVSTDENGYTEYIDDFGELYVFIKKVNKKSNSWIIYKKSEVMI